MVFGSCCILIKDDFYKMKPKKVEINGVQKGLIMNLEVTQTFQNKSKNKVEISYIFPNDMKICIYDIIFVLGNQIIKPKITEKEEALKIYEESIKSDNVGVYGSNIANGLTEFKVGNLKPNVECKVIIKMALEAVIIDTQSFFVKFPLDVYTPSGSVDCLNVRSNFSMHIQAEKDKICNVTSNVINAEFDKDRKIFKIENMIKNKINDKSIMMTFITKEQIQSSVLLAPQEKNNSYDFCAVSIFPNLKTETSTQNDKSEFIFLVDCSGSMEGESIKNAGECLELSIKSLQKESYFNIIRFGTTYQALFKKPKKYNEKNVQKALKLVQNLKADLCKTNILDPLKSIFNIKPKFGTRKVFIFTDGEVYNTEDIIQLVSDHSRYNKCYTIGLGRGCDAGLLEKIARISGGKCDFVDDSKLISDKVIPQIQAAYHGSLTNIFIHAEGSNNNSFEISPFPIIPLSVNNGAVAYLRGKKKMKKGNRFGKGILITGNFNQDEIEIPITNIEQLSKHNEDKYGRSKGENIGNAISALFAFEMMQMYSTGKISKKEKKLLIDLSISSGVLNKYTGYIGISTQSILAQIRYDELLAEKNCFPCEYISTYHPEPFVDSYAFGDTDDEVNDDNKDNAEDSAENNDFDMMKLIRYQNIKGYWNDLDEVNQIAGVKIDKIDSLKLKNPSEEKICIATIVAIASLHVLSPYRQNSWKIIEEKGITWLKNALLNNDINEIIHQIEKLIPIK